MIEVPTAVTTALVGLGIGGSLLPSVSKANGQAIKNLRVSQALSQADSERASLDVTPPLEISPFLLYGAPLKIGSLYGVIGRFSDDSQFLQDCRRDDLMLRRSDFEAAIAELEPPTAWPSGVGEGLPSPHLCLGTDECDVAQRPCPLALDATWVALSGGSPYVAHQEVSRQLSRWRPDRATFCVDEFQTSLLQGRLVQLSGYVILFGLQALVAALFVLGPLAQQLGLTGS